MTPESNKALIRKWIEAWVANDLDLLAELFSPDYTVNGARVGIEGVTQAVRFLHNTLSNISAEVHEFVAEDDRVVIRWTVRGRQDGNFMGFPPTGRELALNGINIYHIVDHKIVANHEQTNLSEVVQKLKAENGVDRV